MNNKNLFLLTFCLCIYLHAAFAQETTDFTPEKITTSDFDVRGNGADSGANAIILFDIGKRTFERNDGGDDDILLKRYIRVKVVNKNGLDAGQFSLYLSTLVPYHNILVKLPDNGLVSLEGRTYNRVNGIIEEVKLDRGSVIIQQQGKNWATVKFAMPALKEGSIFEIMYSCRYSHIIHDLSWSFQHKYPCLWSQYDLVLPNANLYSIKYQGDSSFFKQTVELVNHETINPLFQEKSSLIHFQWIKKNEPGLTPEPFIKSIKNYEDKVSLSHRWTFTNYQTYNFYSSDSWEGFSHIYYFLEGIEDFEDDRFGWLKKDLEQVTAGLQTKKEISFAVFKYIRDNFSCTSHNDYFLSQRLKETFRDKSGNVADLNLLLTAMLKHMRIDAHPAILATTNKEVANLTYPLPNDYDYLICVADIDGRQVLLDASQTLNAYGMLPAYCYNGGAVTLDTRKSRLISLVPDSLLEQNRTNVIMTTDDQGNLSGNITLNCGSQMSFNSREEIKKTSLDKYLNTKISNRVARFSNEEVQDLKNPDKPLAISSDIDFTDSAKSDLFYVRPVIFSYFEKNPFSAVKRKYIVEMPYRMDNIYLLSLDIPKGYTVDEMPASAKINLNNKDGYFEYILEKNGDAIQLQMRMKIDKTFFTIDECENLREFFNQIAKIENEQIVFRKLR